MAGVNTGKADEGAAAGKVANIADLCYKLRGRCVAHAIHGMNGFCTPAVPLQDESSHRVQQQSVRSLRSTPWQLSGSAALCCCFWQCNDMTEALSVNVSSLG